MATGSPPGARGAGGGWDSRRTCAIRPSVLGLQALTLEPSQEAAMVKLVVGVGLGLLAGDAIAELLRLAGSADSASGSNTSLGTGSRRCRSRPC